MSHELRCMTFRGRAESERSLFRFGTRRPITWRFPWNAACLGGCMADFHHADITKAIIGAVYDVFHELGHGYSEQIYRRALAIVLRERGFDVIEEQHIQVIFHGTNIGTFYVDLVVSGKVMIEVKAAKDLEPRDEAQSLNYLKCAGGGIGILVNFGHDVKYRRLAMGDPAANLPNLIDRFGS